jgi:hypothetical protein
MLCRDASAIVWRVSLLPRIHRIKVYTTLGVLLYEPVSRTAKVSYIEVSRLPKV